MSKINVKKLTQVALLIAVEIVLTRFCSIQTPIVRIGFGFLPIALTGMLFGPVWAGCAAAIGDFVGITLFPTAAFFPGFTLTAFLTGFTYGIFLHKQNSWLRTVFAVATVSLCLNLCLDTLWLYVITGQGYLALLPARILKCVIMAPVQILMLRFMASKAHIFAGVAKHGVA